MMEDNPSIEPNWMIFTGASVPHNGLANLPAPPPWRFPRPTQKLKPPRRAQGTVEEEWRASPFLLTKAMKVAVNAALYLRRPLLLTGKPGTGKSTLIAKVAHELRLGPVLRWPISSRSTVRGGVYDYDAVGRLQAGTRSAPPVQAYLKLGPLATALLARSWPRALLIDEIDKSDLDFANDLLNVLEEGEFEIPELRRLRASSATVSDFEGRLVSVERGRLQSQQFPFVVMTSNGEREFPPPFLRRCVRLVIEPPTPQELFAIVLSHLDQHAGVLDRVKINELVSRFDAQNNENRSTATDQLLNAVFLTVAMRDVEGRRFSEDELEALRMQLMQPLSGLGA